MTLHLRDNLNLQSGYAEGYAQGYAEGKLEMIINFLDVLDNETLAKKSRFTVEEIQKLREKHCN